MRETARSPLGLTLSLIALAVLVNVGVGQLVNELGLPLYLDSIGTVLVGVLVGPWAGALAGILSNGLWTLSGLSDSALLFAPAAAAIGLLAGLAGRLGIFRQPWGAALAGLATGFVAAVISAPILAYQLGGITGTATDQVVRFFQNAGANLINAAFGQGIISDPLDKLVSFMLVWAIVQMLPPSLILRFPYARRIRSALSLDTADL